MYFSSAFYYSVAGSKFPIIHIFPGSLLLWSHFYLHLDFYLFRNIIFKFIGLLTEYWDFLVFGKCCFPPTATQRRESETCILYILWCMVYSIQRKRQTYARRLYGFYFSSVCQSFDLCENREVFMINYLKDGYVWFGIFRKLIGESRGNWLGWCLRRLCLLSQICLS